MIKVESLAKTFGSYTAIENIQFTVRQGETFAFLGPNGSGKTTTLKAIAGLVRPTAGRVLINSLDIHRQHLAAASMISYLPQHIIFPENLTAREVIRFYAQLRDIPGPVAEQALNRARLDGAGDKYVGEFSGGMVQRLGLAVAAMSDAPILLLDEPTANLDPHGVKRFREFILEQKENRKTIIFSTHLLDEAEQLADRVGIFVGGRLVTEESIENLHNTYIAKGHSLEDLYLHYVGEDYHEEV